MLISRPVAMVLFRWVVVGALLPLFESAAAAQPAAVTFNRDIAPIVYARCAPCHRPGGSGPFSLLTFADVRPRAALLADVTARRVMPPWKADLEPGQFVGMDPLTTDEIQRIRQWVADGVREGDPADLPPAPRFADGWQLGTPDLVVTPPPYTLPPDGTDAFRIFVVPLPLDRARFVRGLEFRPGNANVVHHATMRIDPTPRSRELDEADPASGYDGLIARTAGYPDGHFLGWTPGQTPPLLPKGLAWRLERGSDLIVELHMQPTGRPETVQPTIGLFFGDDPPVRTPTMLRLGRQRIAMAAGERGYTVTDSFVLPVDVDVQAVQPHAHYRAREIRAWASLPDGTSRPLVTIRDWDFHWQHVYRFVHPMSLPKGTTIAMRYTYDNSSANRRNPSPSAPVVWGQRSSDEMGDLWVQVLTHTDRDRQILADAFAPKMIAEDIVGYQERLRVEPESVSLHDDIALLYLATGDPARAAAHFGESARLNPKAAATHYNLGIALAASGNARRAVEEYRLALDINPEYALAHNNLGAALLQQGDVAGAIAHLQTAVRIMPEFPEAQHNAGVAYLMSGDKGAAIAHLNRAVALAPHAAGPSADLAWLLATVADDRLRDAPRAVRLAERAADATGRSDARVLDVLGAAYAAAGEFDRAIAAAEAALARAGQQPLSTVIRERLALYRAGRLYLLP